MVINVMDWDSASHPISMGRFAVCFLHVDGPNAFDYHSFGWINISDRITGIQRCCDCMAFWEWEQCPVCGYIFQPPFKYERFPARPIENTYEVLYDPNEEFEELET